MKIIHIKNRDQPLQEPLQAFTCDSFLSRLRGWMFRSNLAHEEGLLLVERQDSRLNEFKIGDHVEFQHA